MGEDSGVEGRWRGRNSIAKTLLKKLEEKSGRAARRRGTVHAETREGFEFERVLSCGGEHWRRAQLDFCSGEPFDDHHWCTTLVATPEIVQGGGVLVDLRLLCGSEQVKATWQENGASRVGQETAIADAHEALGE